MKFGKLLKRRSSRDNIKVSRHTVCEDLDDVCCDKTHRDDSTSSLSSGGSKAAHQVESLACEKKFDDLLQIVAQSDPEDWCCTNTIDSSPSSPSLFQPRTFLTPLHIVVAHDPPPKVVEDLLDGPLKKKLQIHVLEECQDEMGQTPLHVAAANGCEEQVAERLLSGTTLMEPAVTKDHQERYPLHWACCTPILKNRGSKRNLFGGKSTAMSKWHKRQVIQVLLDTYPEAVTVEDVHGKTPLEYARENADLRGYPTLLALMERLSKLHCADESTAAHKMCESSAVMDRVLASSLQLDDDDVSCVTLDD